DEPQLAAALHSTLVGSAAVTTVVLTDGNMVGAAWPGFATDAAYSWSHTVVNRDNPAGDASMVRNARAAWANEAEALRWANEQKTHAVIPVSRAAQLVLEERKQK
ncbi:MAG TPA: hypothetical protein PKE00_04855, partial [Planctomycetota bacterium]|nr:hypothetical protein [Planctomycetota bacterium]